MRRSKALRTRVGGFTLYELMLVVAIAAILAAVGIPNMREFIWNSRLTGAANDLIAAVHRTRSESVKRHIQTVMCFSDNPSAATPACGGSGRLGWVAFADTDGDGQVDAGEDIFVRHGALANAITVKSLPAGNARYLAFNSAGFARDIALGTDLAGIVLCDQRGNVATNSGPLFSAARGLLISPTGRPRVTRVVTEISAPALGGCT